MRKILSRILLVMVVLVILVITLYVVIYPSDTQCLLVKWSGMKEINKKIYVDSSLSREQVNTLLECIKSAKDRVSKLYGSLRTNPTFIVGNSDEFIKKYGMHHHAGSTRRQLIVTFITLGSEGMNSTDIIAHELCHSELGDRLGLFKKLMIPVWFDDGLATQVDYRPMYSDEVWKEYS
jgi:hypothetical protein